MMNVQSRQIGIITVLVFFTQIIIGQNDLLEKRISFSKQTTTVAAALKLIEELTPCTFSYAGGIVQKEKVVLIWAKGTSVREVLYQMFGHTVHCTQRKNIIILTKNKSNTSTASGYVQNAYGEPIANATVYDPDNLRSTRTNAYGYFEMQLRSDSIKPLVISKSLHRDTLMVAKGDQSLMTHVVLSGRDTTWHDRLMEWPDSIKMGFLKMSQWTEKKIDNLVEMRNVRDTLSRSGQISLVPFVGSNGRLSGRVANDWSLNLIGGLNGAVHFAEVGGVFNVNRGDVRYFQLAGMLNLVDGDVRGCQIGGVANVNNKSINGFQCGGIVNINHGSSVGLMAAGVVNMNLNGVKGLAAAGVYNHSSDTLIGAQIAGIFNTARIVKGVQIGLINKADTVHGASFGFISIVKSGYQQVALHYDEWDYLGMQWRTGTHFFYNIVDIGVQTVPVKTKTHFSYGYGIGVSTNSRKPWVWNNDFTVHHLVPGEWKNSQEYLGRYYCGVEKRWGRIWALAFGFSANLYAFEMNQQQIPLSIEQNQILWSEDNHEGLSYKLWIGWRAGMRFNLNPKPRRS